MLRPLGLAALAVLLAAPAAWACPFCDGGPAGTNPVRDTIFGDDFWHHLAAVLLPFPLFLGIAALLARFSDPAEDSAWPDTPTDDPGAGR